MAKADLQKLADQLIDQLKKDNDEFRQQVSNIRTHHFTVSVDGIIKQSLEQLKSKTFIDEEIPKSIKDIIHTEAPKLFSTLRASLKPTKGLSVEFEKDTATEFFCIISQAAEGGAVSIYNYIKPKKGEAQKSLVLALDEEITRLNKESGVNREGTLSKANPKKISRPGYKHNPKGLLFDIGHTEGVSISEERAKAFNLSLIHI